MVEEATVPNSAYSATFFKDETLLQLRMNVKYKEHLLTHTTLFGSPISQNISFSTVTLFLVSSPRI